MTKQDDIRARMREVIDESQRLTAQHHELVREYNRLREELDEPDRAEGVRRPGRLP